MILSILERMPTNFQSRLFALLVIGTFNLIIFNRYFPLSEGWWEAYGYLYNLGLRPYKDFDLAFTPLFTIINAGLLDVFGSSFFSIRLFGVFVYLLAIFSLQMFLEQFYSAKSSAVAVVVASFLVFSEPQFIAKDYHTYQLLLVSLVLLLHTWIVTSNHLSKLKNITATFVLGLIVCLVVFLKQNVGVLLFFSILLSLFLQRGLLVIPRLLALCLGLIVALFLMLPIVSLADWHYVLFANDAKGDLTTVLFRALIDPRNRGILKISVLIAIVYFFVKYVLNFKVNEKVEYFYFCQSSIEQLIVQRVFLACATLLIIGVAVTNTIYGLFRESIIPITLALLIILIYKVYKQMRSSLNTEISNQYVVIVLPLAALAYSNTNTASFDFNGMQIPVAFAIGWILSRIEKLPSQNIWLFTSLFFLAIVPRIAIGKIMVPYFWWGNIQGSVLSAKYQTNYSDLKGIYVNAKYRDVFNIIKRTVDDYSISQTDVYFYNLPIFYLLHKKTPPFRAVVHWFDVVSSRQMNNELLAIEKQPPRIIVALEPSPLAFKVHSQLKNIAHLPQEDFRTQLDLWVNNKKYRLVKSIALPTQFLNQPSMANMDITQDVTVQNPDIIGKDVKSIFSELGLLQKNIKILGVFRNGLTYNTDGFILHAGDILMLQGSYQGIMMLSEQIGVARESPRDWNSVNIYLRDDVQIDTY
jgi:hypothetical protein